MFVLGLLRPTQGAVGGLPFPFGGLPRCGEAGVEFAFVNDLAWNGEERCAFSARAGSVMSRERASVVVVLFMEAGENETPGGDISKRLPGNRGKERHTAVATVRTWRDSRANLHGP